MDLPPAVRERRIHDDPMTPACNQIGWEERCSATALEACGHRASARKQKMRTEARYVTDDRKTGSRSASRVALCDTWLQRLHGAGGAERRGGCKAGALSSYNSAMWTQRRADAPGVPLTVASASSSARSWSRQRSTRSAGSRRPGRQLPQLSIAGDAMGGNGRITADNPPRRGPGLRGAQCWQQADEVQGLEKLMRTRMANFGVQ